MRVRWHGGGESFDDLQLRLLDGYPEISLVGDHLGAVCENLGGIEHPAQVRCELRCAGLMAGRAALAHKELAYFKSCGSPASSDLMNCFWFRMMWKNTFADMADPIIAPTCR